MKIKEARKEELVVFKGSKGAKLGELSEEQLKQLAIITQRSGSRHLKDLWEDELPSLEELQKENVDKAIKQLEPNGSKNTGNKGKDSSKEK